MFFVKDNVVNPEVHSEKIFERIKQTTKDEIEFWFARDLQIVLEYAKWENFINVIDKAKDACRNSGNDVADHFPGIRKMVDIGSGAERPIDDYMLSRYACYLVVQNGDSKKETIALGQTSVSYTHLTLPTNREV